MRYLYAVILLLAFAFADEVKLKRWEKSQNFLQYLQKHGISQKLYYALDGEDKELVSEIYAGVPYYELLDSNGSLIQSLIPINEELQIHLFKKAKGYGIDLIPIKYDKKNEKLSITLNGAPYMQILEKTGNVKLATEFVRAFRNSFDFSHSIHKGDKLAILYDQKYRLGQLFGMPKIKVAMIQIGKKRHYVFGYKGHYYDRNGKELESFLLQRPISGARITSRFTLKRWHPILHRYRAHLGVDFGARRGTPIHAAGDGTVIFVGRKGGYGNVVIIAHRGGYKTLYAHMSRFRKGIRVGKHVKQGQIIGYVGSTGLSTGPHLHFGLYKNNRPIDPLRVVRIAKSRLRGKELESFKRLVAQYKKEIDELVKRGDVYHKVPKFKIISYIGGGDGEARVN